MPLVSQPIISLLNGVSQQPASLRHPSQAEEQINCYSGLAVGLKKRPPMEHVAKLMTNPLASSGYAFHTINRSSTEQYIVAIEDGDVRVFDLTGVEKTVNYAEHRFFSLSGSVAVEDGKSERIYVPPGVTTIDLATSGITTATVVWETSTTGAFAGEETTVRTDTADTDASVSVTDGNWYRATVTAWTAGTINAWIDWPDVSYLKTSDPNADIRMITIQDYTFIANDAITCAMNTDDTEPNAEAITATVQTFGDLPSPMPGAGFIYKITGDILNEVDTYFVKVDATNTVYEEYKDVGNTDSFDQASLPHTLVDNQDGTFTYANGAWNARVVGDTTTNQDPPFIGGTIRELFFHRNRLGFVSGENVSLSRVGTAPGGYFDFWRETIPVVLDSDPIHLESPHYRRSRFNNAVSFNETMLLFSDEAQFVLNADGTMTPSSAQLDVTTEFSAAGDARPAAVGQNVYFPVDTGSFVGVREYYVEEDSSTNNAADVTAHVAQYIPATPTKLIGSSNEDLLLMLTSGDTDSIYVYKFFWDGNTKAQSSWSKWEFDGDEKFLNIDFIGPTVWCLTQRTSNTSNDEIWLSKIELNDSDSEDDIGVAVHLDRLETATGTYHSGSDRTYWTPAAVPQAGTQTGDQWVVVTGSGFATPGEAPAVTMGGTLTASEDETNYDGTGSNGTFAGGTGYAVSDTITTALGAIITVDAVSAGVVTQFTVTTGGVPYKLAEYDGATPDAQQTTSGSGTGFTLSPGSANVTSNEKVLIVGSDFSAAACWLGMEYEQRYKFSEQFYREGETGSADLIGRLQLRKMNVRFNSTGYFKAVVTPKARSASTYLFTGAVLGTQELTLGALNLYTGTFQFPVLGRSTLVDIELKNASWLPATFLSAEWIGLKTEQSVIP